MKFSIKNFFSRCTHLLKNSSMENFIFCAVHFFTKIKTYEKTYADTEEFRFNVLLATWK